MNKQEMTSIVYDTIMRNTDNLQFNTHFVENQELNANDGLITFNYGTNGKKYIITVHELPETSEDIEMLERENKAMADYLENMKGISREEVGEIANGKYLTY